MYVYTYMHVCSIGYTLHFCYDLICDMRMTMFISVKTLHGSFVYQVKLLSNFSDPETIDGYINAQQSYLYSYVVEAYRIFLP